MSAFENLMGNSDKKIVVTKFTSLNSRSIWTKAIGVDGSQREVRKRVRVILTEFDDKTEPMPAQAVTESGEGIVEVPVTITTEADPAVSAKGEGTPVSPSNNVVEEVKEEVVKDKVQESPPIVEGNSGGEPVSNNIWQQREAELLKKIQDLESVRSEASADGLKLELKLKDEEIDILRAKIKNLETELHAALSKSGGKNQEVIENIKQQHEELLSKARGMIFDKTKVVKNQELQIEALSTQVQSLKDINTITKDLLEIRNSEVKAMEDRLVAMEARFKAERERHELIMKRAEATNTLNADLKKEYEMQLSLFKELRVKYDERLQVLLTENNRLKESMKTNTS